MKPYIISGPCSAESENQVLSTARMLADLKIDVFRCGIWKPRTKPNTFEGVGKIGLKWLNQVQKDLGLKVAVEVANSAHVEIALQAGIDALWLGARSVTSPFVVQEICDALQGVDIPILVKNPITPDIELWTGAIERLQKGGIQHITAVHRGFGAGGAIYRNNPQWHIPIELHRRFPDMRMLCDASHIAGASHLVEKVALQAMQLNFSGLMIETHCKPDEALSDTNQQITPAALKTILQKIVVCQKDANNEQLSIFRSRIDDLDNSLLEILSQRMRLAQEIGLYKRENNISVLQENRYEEVLQSFINRAKIKNLDTDFVKKIVETIHGESIKNQF
jgi:chorismate mutase